MPLYEYRCTQCDHLFEANHEVGGAPGPCPICGGPARRVFTSVGLIFKGSGFHTTDYRKPSPSDGADKKKSSADALSPDVPAKDVPAKNVPAKDASAKDAPPKDAPSKPKSSS